MLKRVVDIFLGLLALCLLGLPMLAIGLLVRLDSPGAAIFRQRRAGWRGKAFTMLKFRTMRSDAEPYGGSPRSGEDPRLTRLGRFLRESSLDELPQLLNVLDGQMSLVGPRPLYERQAEQWDENQRHRLDVRPGITGYAQAYGRGGLTIEDKIEMDLYYVQHQNMWLDVRILIRTVLNAFGGRGEIYEQRYSRRQDREDTSGRSEGKGGSES